MKVLWHRAQDWLRAHSALEEDLSPKHLCYGAHNSLPSSRYLMSLASADTCTHVHAPMHRSPHMHIIINRKSFYKTSGRTLAREAGRLAPDLHLFLLSSKSNTQSRPKLCSSCYSFPSPIAPSRESSGSFPPNFLPPTHHFNTAPQLHQAWKKHYSSLNHILSLTHSSWESSIPTFTNRQVV